MRKILQLFLAWRFLTIGVILMAGLWLTLQPDFLGRSFGQGSLLAPLWPLANFDGAHYLSIASSGYSRYEYAFFPLYPYLIKGLALIWPDPLSWGLLINLVALPVSLWLLNKLWQIDYSTKLSWQALLLLLTFPTAFYFGAIYTESLFLLFSVASIYFARRQRYWLSGISGALACATRLVGIFLLPAVLILWYQSKSRRISQLLPILAISSGLLLVLWLNWQQTGDALYFVHVQPSFGANRSAGQLVLLPQVLFRYFKIFLTNRPQSLLFWSAASELFWTLSALVMTYFCWRKKEYANLIFCLGLILLPTLTGTLSSMPRYVLVAWPLYPHLAGLMQKRALFWLVLVLFIIWQMINLSLFARGYWVA